MLDWIFELGFMAILFRAFNIQPRIEKEGDMLTASTGLPLSILTLFSASRRLLVDPKQKAVRIRDRHFWFFAAWHRIPFDMIESILYTYSDVSPGQYSWSNAYRTMDLFDVSLRLRDGQERRLFRFFGEGEFVNNGIWPDWCYWSDYMADPLVVGNQESRSKMFVEVLSRIIGAPISNGGAYVP